MLFSSIQPIKPGMQLKASWLNKLVRGVNRSESATGPNTVFIGGGRFTKESQEQFVMVKLLADAMPESIEEWSSLERPDGVVNAVRVSWSDGEKDWVSTGQAVTVTVPNDLPLRKGLAFMARLDPGSGRYVPTRERETEMVRITNTTRNADGFYEAVILKWNSDTYEWEEGDDCFVLDANPDATAASCNCSCSGSGGGAGGLTQAEADLLYDPLGAAADAIAAHEAAVDPHPTYLTQAEGDARYPLTSSLKYQTVQEGGVDETQRAKLNFVDTNTVELVVTDDGGGDRSTITANALLDASGSLTSTAGGIKLSGDAASPGAGYFYGTNSGGTKGWLSIGGSNIPNNAITDSHLRDSAGVSVIGRSANSTGDPADIVASANDQFLVRRSNVLGFGTLVAADVPALSGFGSASSVADTDLLFSYVSSANSKMEFSVIRKAIMPVGSIIPYSGSSAPTGWELCDGGTNNRTTDADLFAVCGTSFGAGNGTTTFNRPDLRGRTIIGTGTGSGLTARSLANSLGTETHGLSTTELPSHTHQPSGDAVLRYTGSGGSYSLPAGGTDVVLSITIPNTGGGVAHNNMQPSLVCTYIIKK